MVELETWNIDNKYNIKEFKQYINNNPELKVRHLLDTSKDKYTILEKFIYDTSMFHLNRLNIYNERLEDYYIEFWCKSKYNDQDNNIYIECDQELKKDNIFYFPLLSCVTYFTTNTNTPTIISNIDLDSYKYKDFEKQHSIILSLPKIYKQITFDGHFYHGDVSLADDSDTAEFYKMSINLWNKKPKNIEYYIPKYDTALSNKEDGLISFNVDTNATTIKVSEDMINYDFFNSLLYGKNIDVCYVFNEVISANYISDNANSTYVLEVDKSIKRNENINKLKNICGDVIDDYEEILNSKNEFKYNRFFQRFQYENIYSENLCNFIIKETELYVDKYGWSTRNINNYLIRDVSVKQIPSISKLIYSTLDNILDIILRSYNLNTDKISNNVMFDILDVFIVKDVCDDKNSILMHQDKDFFSFSILLNNADDFEGNGIIFSDGLIHYLNQGDMIIYNGMVKHSSTPILKGVRYLLVGFIDLKFVQKKI